MFPIVLNSNQRLTFFRQTQILCRHQNLYKQNNEVFQTFDKCLTVFYQNNNKFPLTKVILNEPIF